MVLKEKNLCLVTLGKRLSAILFFSVFSIFIGIGLKPANAINVVAIENLPTENLANHNQNSIGGWAGQSFKATQNNISGVSVYTGYGGYAETPNPRSDTRMTVILRDSSGNNIDYTQSQEYLAVSQGLEMYVAFDEPLALTVGTNYQFVVVWEDVRMTYHEESSPGSYADGQNLDGLGDLKFKIWYEDGSTGSDDYVMYYGNNPVYTNIGSNYDLPIVYDVCDNWGVYSSPVIYLHDEDEYDLADYQDLTQCSGTIIFSSSSGTVQHSENAHFHLFDSNGLDLESNEFLNNVDYQVLANNDYIHYYYPNDLYINTSFGSGTSTINFAYSVCSDPNWASSTIYLVNEDNGGNSGVSYTPTACTGAASMEFPYAEDLNLSFPASFSYQRGGIEYLKSTIFNVVFYSDSPNIDIEGDNATSTSLVVTWGKSVWNRLINIFPFNIPVAMRRAWLDSETAALPSDLEFLDMVDSNNDLKGTFPKEWLGSDTDMDFTLFGRDMIANGSQKALDTFENFKNFTKYLQWFAFIWGFIFFAKKIISDLTENKSDNM